MAGRASIARHPIHPALVTFPIGLWIFSFISDLIFLWGTGNPFWKDVAFYTMAAGVIGAALAAVPGFVDYLTIVERPAKRVATTHLGLNVLVLVLYIVNLWIRRDAPPEARGPVWLSLASVILLAISGWLGGELVFRHGVAVEPHREAGTIDVTRRTEPPSQRDVRRPA